jgi:hypothetical protein
VGESVRDLAPCSTALVCLLLLVLLVDCAALVGLIAEIGLRDEIEAGRQVPPWTEFDLSIGRSMMMALSTCAKIVCAAVWLAWVLRAADIIRSFGIQLLRRTATSLTHSWFVPKLFGLWWALWLVSSHLHVLVWYRYIHVDVRAYLDLRPELVIEAIGYSTSMMAASLAVVVVVIIHRDLITPPPPAA